MKDRPGKEGENPYVAEVQELVDRHSLEELAALVDVVRAYYRQCVKALDQKRSEQQTRKHKKSLPVGSQGRLRKAQGPVVKGRG